MSEPAFAETRRRSASGVRTLVFRQAVVLAMGALFTTYLARKLGPSAWGGFAVSYVALVLADGVLSRALVVGVVNGCVPADTGWLRAAVSLTVATGLGLAVALLAVAFAAGPFYSPPDFELLMGASSVCVLLYSARAVPLAMLERELRYRRVAASEIADKAAFFSVAVPGVALGYELRAVAAATVVRGAAAAAVVAADRVPPRPQLRAAMNQVRRLARLGAPSAATLALVSVDGLVPLAVLGRDTKEVGFFLIASTLLGYAVTAATAVQRVGVPGLSRLPRPGRGRAAQRAVTLSTFASVAVLLPLAGSASLWIEPVLGSAWPDAVEIVELFAAGLALWVPGAVLSTMLTAEGETDAVLRLQVAATGVYLIGGALLTALVGPLGCAIAFVVSRATWSALCAVAVARRSHVWPEGDVAIVLVAGLLALAAAGAARATFAVPLSAAVAGLAVVAFVAVNHRVARACVRAAVSGLNEREGVTSARAAYVGLRPPGSNAGTAP
jgi:PST family polysaccharide transporter